MRRAAMLPADSRAAGTAGVNGKDSRTGMISLVRGVFTQSVIWGVLWAIAGVIITLIVSVVDPPSIDAGEGPADIAWILGPVGMGTGLLFGLLVALVERGRAVRDIPLIRAALWGLVAGAIVPLVTPLNDVVVFNTAPLGAIVAVISVALARGASRWRTRRRPTPAGTQHQAT